jgi:hypothetical protein
MVEQLCSALRRFVAKDPLHLSQTEGRLVMSAILRREQTDDTRQAREGRMERE